MCSVELRGACAIKTPAHITAQDINLPNPVPYFQVLTIDSKPDPCQDIQLQGPTRSDRCDPSDSQRRKHKIR